jgi:hypothetical protein
MTSRLPLPSQYLDSTPTIAASKHGRFRISKIGRTPTIAATAVPPPLPPQINFRTPTIAATEWGLLRGSMQ